MTKNINEIWKDLFTHDIIEDFNLSLTKEIYKDPYNKILERIFFIYSMKTFLYSSLNIAARTHDHTKILSFGPFSMALSICLEMRASRRDSHLKIRPERTCSYSLEDHHS